ncbi:MULTISPECIES: hypothetical protein [Gammaproteobacteria]|uniref:hypothetical protein n=1 Tax=Gammaproteobacteria TaxID=1236 RepID=UPI002FCA9C84
MATIEQGKQAVWTHCKEAGIQDDIKLISKYFDIKDICLIHGGKISYIDDMPRRIKKIHVATVPDKTLADYLKEAKNKK